MRKVVHKAFLVTQFDKEEEWLNEMAAKGLCLVAVGFCRYEFEECLPGEYSVCLELLENAPAHPESERYIAFLEETGAEHVGSFMRWVYFRKKAADGPFELYSDAPSRIRHLTRVITLIGVVGGLNLFIGVWNIIICITLHSGFNAIGIVNFVIGVLCMVGVFRLMKKRKRLKAEQQLFE